MFDAEGPGQLGTFHLNKDKFFNRTHHVEHVARIVTDDARVTTTILVGYREQVSDRRFLLCTKPGTKGS